MGWALNGVAWEAVSEKMTFELRPEGWEGVSYALSKRRTVLSRENSKDESLGLGRMLGSPRTLRRAVCVQSTERGVE